MFYSKLEGIELVGAQKIVAYLLFASAGLKVVQLFVTTAIGLPGSNSFYYYNILVALVLGIGVFSGFRLAWILAATVSLMQAYSLTISLIDLPWSLISANGISAIWLFSIVLTMLLYFLTILSFFWLERLRISRDEAKSS